MADFFIIFNLIFWSIIIVCLILFFVDLAINHGIEIVDIYYPPWSSYYIQNTILEFFEYKDFDFAIYGNRIIARKGERWLMGIRTFDILLLETAQGCLFRGHFYLEGIIPKYMKLTRFGYYAGLPRRMGWKIKNELFEYLNYKVRPIG